MTKPTHGFTRHGHAVHGRTVDHLPTDTAYARFNKKVALALTKYVGTMTTFWIFCVISLCSLPAVLSLVIPTLGRSFPHWLIATSLVSLVAWISSNFIQLVLLPCLMVGQNLQNAASDARADKQFQDTELIVDRLDEHTEGGIKSVLDRIDALETK
jgi:hypothetical protein